MTFFFFLPSSRADRAGRLLVQICTSRPLPASSTPTFQAGRSLSGAWYVHDALSNKQPHFDPRAHSFIDNHSYMCMCWSIPCFLMWRRSTDPWWRASEQEAGLASCQESTPPSLSGKTRTFTSSTMGRRTSRCRTWLPGRWRNRSWTAPEKSLMWTAPGRWRNYWWWTAPKKPLMTLFVFFDAAASQLIVVVDVLHYWSRSDSLSRYFW